MHVILLGATGRTGTLVVEEALARNHTVTAVVRDPGKLTTRSPSLHVLKGSVTNKDDIGAALDSALKSTSPSNIAFIVTLSAQRASDSPFAKPISPPHLLQESLEAVTGAMRSRSVKRIVNMSAFGVADSSPNMNWVLRMVIRKSNMAVQFADHDAADADMKERHELEWVMVRPVMLKEGEATSIKDWGDAGKGVGLLAGITRKSVAQALVEAVETDKWVRRTPVLTS